MLALLRKPYGQVLMLLILLAVFVHVVSAATGNRWRQASESFKLGYASGYGDALLTANIAQRNGGNVTKIAACLEGKNPDQLAAMIRKYLADHPEVWDQDMTVIMIRVFSNFCT